MVVLVRIDLVAENARLCQELWRCGVGKMWHALKRCDIEIGCEQTRPIMALAGVKGKGKGKSPVTTRKSRNVDTRPDLVQRDFRALAPNRL